MKPISQSVGSSAATVTGLLAGQAAAMRWRATGPIEGVGRLVIERTPGAVVDVTVALVESMDKPLLRAGIYVQSALAGSSLRAIGSRLADRGSPIGPPLRDWSSAAAPLAGSVAAYLRPAGSSRWGTLAAGLVAVAAARSVQAMAHSHPTAPVVAVALTAAWADAERRRRRRLERHQRQVVHLPDPRRRVADPASTTPGGKTPSVRSVAGLSPLLTPVASFFETDTSFPVPHLTYSTWRLLVNGLVEQPLALSFDQLLGMDLVELDATLVCVHNPVGGSRVGTARWVGVPVSQLLDRAGVQPGGRGVIAHGIDGFSARIPLSVIDGRDDALVAVGMGGRPLTPGHGAPARLLVPGLYGYDSATKWLSRLQVSSSDEDADYWTRRGWPAGPARVVPSSRIDVPVDEETVRAGWTLVAGVAWAPPTGVRGVQVRVGNDQWQDAELGPDLGPDAWRQWWRPVAVRPGLHKVQARVLTQEGVQEERSAPPFPAGATGLHEVRFQAVEGILPRQELPARGKWTRTVRSRLGLARRGAAAWLHEEPLSTSRRECSAPE